MKSYSKISISDISLEDQLNNIKRAKGALDIVQYSKEDLENINEVFALYRELKSLKFFVDRGPIENLSKEEEKQKRAELKANLEENANSLMIEIEKRWWKLSAEARAVVLKDAASSNNPIIDSFLRAHIKVASKLEKDEIIYRTIFLDAFSKNNISIDKRNSLFRKYIDSRKYDDIYYARLKMAVNLEKILEISKDKNSLLNKEQIVSNLNKVPGFDSTDSKVDYYGILSNDFEDILARNNFLNWYDANEKNLGGKLSNLIISKDDEQTNRNIDAYFSCKSENFNNILIQRLTLAKKLLTYPRNETYYEKIDSAYKPITSAEKNKKNPKYTFEQLYEMYLKSDIFQNNSKIEASKKINRFYDSMLRMCFGNPSIRDVDFIESIYYEAKKHPEIANSKPVEEYYFPIKDVEREGFKGKSRVVNNSTDREEIDYKKVEEYIQEAEDNDIQYLGEFIVNSGVKAKSETGVHYYEFQNDRLKFLVPIGQKNNAIRIINSEKSMKEISEDMMKKGLVFNDLVAQGKASRFYNTKESLYDPNRLIIFSELAERAKLFSDTPDISVMSSNERVTLPYLRSQITKSVPFDKVGEAAEYVRTISKEIGYDMTQVQKEKEINSQSTEEVYLEDYLSRYQIKRFEIEARNVFNSDIDEEGYYFNKVTSKDAIEKADKDEVDI